MSANVRSFYELLAIRANDQPNDAAYIFLDDHGTPKESISFGDLFRRALSVATSLRQHCSPGDRAILAFAPGLDFFIAFFGSLVAGVIAVPVAVPRRRTERDATEAIVLDCGARLVLSSHSTLAARSDVTDRFRTLNLTLLFTDACQQAETHSGRQFVAPASTDVAFLQYTSGSTSQPKGVVITHDNMIENSEMLRLSLGNSARSTHVSWLPHYHDMGLMANALQTFYIGALCVLMNPVAYMQRPHTWLRAIHDFRAEVACGPNFAYDLCVERFKPDLMQGVDLSCWKVALNGAEPILPDTIKRFVSTFSAYGIDPSAVFPAYGLAEATVFVSAGKRGAGATIRSFDAAALHLGKAAPAGDGGEARHLVACGMPGERIAIVDADRRLPLPPNTVGEIWIQGANIGSGYWGKKEETDQVFRARLAGAKDQREWLRSGDLGFLDGDGRLFITGRLKDLIIIRGSNHYPQDIELTVQTSHPALRRNHGVAFSSADGDAERLIIVQEVERTQRNHVAVQDLKDAIREAVVREHGIAPFRIVLIRPGQIPKTTSGKIQRNTTRNLWQAGQFEEIKDQVNKTGSSPLSS